MGNTKNRLAQLREENNVSQAKLSQILGVSPGCISLWESGKRTIDIKHLKKLAAFFNVSIDYLTGFSPLEQLEQLELNEEERELFNLIKEIDDEHRELFTLIKEMDEEQTKTLSDFVDFLISKRK